MTTVEKYLPESGYQRWKTVLEGLTPAPLPDVDPEAPGQAISARALRVIPSAQGSRIELKLDQIPASVAGGLQLVLTGRKRNIYFICADPVVERRAFGRGTKITFDVDADKFSESMDETFDVSLRRPYEQWNAKRRIRPPKDFAPVGVGAREWYSTNLGNFSVRPRPLD